MKHISEIMTAVCKEHGITMNQGDREMTISNIRDKIQAMLEMIRDSDNESVWEHSVDEHALILALELQFICMSQSDSEHYSLTDTGRAWLLIREARLHPNYDKLKEAGGVLFIPSRPSVT